MAGLEPAIHFIILRNGNMDGLGSLATA